MLEDEFGDIVKKARKGFGLSAEEVHQATGVDPQTLAEMEAYRYTPTDQQVHALAHTLGLNAAKLTQIARNTWAPKPEPWLARNGVSVTPVPVDIGGYIENSYILASPSERRAVIVDPGGDAEKIAGTVGSLGLTAEAVLITHGHSDHTGGAARLAKILDLNKVIGHPEALRSLSGADLAPHHVEDGDEFSAGGLAFQVLHTPGHTTGSCCFLTGSICCVGDTLFAGSLGGVSGGPAVYQTLLESVRSKLLSLPPAIVLLPGHGPATTVREELEHNPFF